MLEEMLCADRVTTWWKAGGSGDVLRSVGGRWHLCRTTAWLLRTRYTEKANKLAVTGK